MSSACGSRLNWRALTLRGMLAGTLLLVGLAAGWAIATTRAAPGPGVVLLCVTNWTGQVRYVTSAAQCTTGTILEINQQGVPGAQGPPGPAGPQGPPGVSGLGNVVIRTASGTFAAHAGGSVLVGCESGEIATGGGFQKPTGVEVSFSGPSTQIGSSTPTIWWVQAANPTSSSVTVEAWAVCAAG